ncbi:hypothetical protein TWF173_008001 [Orbilia oligospora]|nr:hypothetical protein TWF173_008001 [Orbilia oligospora]
MRHMGLPLILPAASSVLRLRPLFSKRSVNKNDLQTYMIANRDRLETLWGAPVDFQADIESHLINRDLELDPGLDNFSLDITDQQPTEGISLNAALSDIPESQNPPFLELTHVQDQYHYQNQDQIQDQTQIPAGIEISADSHSGPDAGVIEVMANALKTPLFCIIRSRRPKGKTKTIAIMAIWVFHWLMNGPATPDFNGVINLSSSKLDLEEGNMDLAVAIDEAMEEYWKALSQALEFVFSYVAKKSVKIEAFKEELIMIYDYMAVYEGNLRKVAAIIQARTRRRMGYTHGTAP